MIFTEMTGYYCKQLPQSSSASFMLVWCWKQVKDFILKSSLNRSFFSEKFITFTLTSLFTSGEGVYEVVDNRPNCQVCQYDVHFPLCQTFSVIRFGNPEGVSWITSIFNIYIHPIKSQLMI